MNATYTATPGKPQKITVESHLLYVLWQQGIASAGFEAAFEVKTALVGDGAKVKASCFTEKGKKLCQTEGEILGNRFIGKVLIPEKTDPDDFIYLKVNLPKHSLNGESNLIPVRPLVSVSSLQWSKKEIRRNEEARLTCIFASGVKEGDPAEVSIYEYDRGGNHDPIVTIPAEVKAGKVELAWNFNYQDDTRDIPTASDLKKQGKQYQQPGYFFTVTIHGQIAGEKQESGILLFNDTVEVSLAMGRTPPREKTNCTIAHADGSEIKTTPNADGTIGIEKAPPGPFTLKIDGCDQTLSGKSGTHLIAVFPEDILLTDIHMHTQSNNCCPLPLQWAVIAKVMGPSLGRPVAKDRKQLSDLATNPAITTLFSGRFGNIGRISSDLIGKLYLHDLRDADMNMEISWIVEEKNAAYPPNKTYTEKERRIAGQKAGLSTMSSGSAASWQEEFLKATKYYFTGTRIHRLCLSLSMDLSCATYWSRTGLPLYLPSENTMLFINDFAAAEVRRDSSTSNAKVTFLESVVTPRSRRDPNVNRYADPAYLMIGPTVMHLHAASCAGDFFHYSGSSLYRRQYDLRHGPGGAGENDWPLVSFAPETAACLALLEKKFVHLLSAAHHEDNAHFEDYAVQRKRIIDTMVNYPLALFGAYHFDPRRHFLSKTTTVTQLAEAIVKDHSFFIAEPDKTTDFRLSNGVEYRGSVRLSPHRDLNSPAKIEKLLLDHQRSVEDALKELFIPGKNGSGLFWAIKMYPRLGYAPNDYTRFPNLTDLYKTCADSCIPITAHSSPGGMFAADYFLYERYDDHIIKNKYDLDHAEKRFDGVLPAGVSKDAPQQWAAVLKDYPKLKLCLAHFGGIDTWRHISSFKSAEEKLASRPVQRDPNRYDSADLYRDWIKSIAELVQNYDNVYTDLAFFYLDPPRPALAGPSPGEEEIKSMARDLVFLLKKYPGLKDRVMAGTDWYLIEQGRKKGIGDYMHRMFELLKMVSRDVNYDAWHQFSVVNPLRYLGLIEEKKGSAGPFEMKSKVLEEYGERLKGRASTRLQKKDSVTNLNSIVKSIDSKVKMFKNLKIADSSLLKKGNDLLILCE